MTCPQAHDIASRVDDQRGPRTRVVCTFDGHLGIDARQQKIRHDELLT
jgi:hypothetical protein